VLLDNHTKENLELNKFPMKELTLTTKLLPESNTSLYKKLTLITMKLNTKLNMFLNPDTKPE
jgi:hypothetical protein